MAAITTDEWTQTITSAIREDYANPKDLASASGSNLETARNWWAGRHAPAGAYLCRLMAQSQRVLTAVLRLSGNVDLAEVAELRAEIKLAEHRIEQAQKKLNEMEARL